MPDNFDERFSGLPVDATSTPLISDIVGNAQIASPQFNLVPVDYNPFPKKRKGPAAFNDELPSEMIRPDAPVADKMFGLNGKERYQFFPERLARSVYDIMSGQVAPYNPSTGEYNVEGAMDVAGLLGGAPLGMKPGTASLGSGAVRPIMNANKNEVAKPFFSAVEKAVTDISQPKMTGQQWLGTLSNKPGVKPEELDWIGLKDYLKENADKVVTKQEIESHVAANKVELKDVDKGNTFNYPYKTHDEWESAIMKAERKNDWDEVSRLNLAWEQSEGQGHGGPKYSKYQLPGGENYREKLLTLPNELKGEKAVQFDKFISEGRGDLAARLTKDLPEDYKSSHWDEPNVLAHVRMNDRTMNGEGVAVRNKISGNTSQVFPTEDAAKAYTAKNFPENYHSKFEYVPANRPVKSLHIEEIQSDWHQQGRQQGYKDQSKIDALQKQLDEVQKNYKPMTELPEGYGLIKDGNKWGVLPPNQNHGRPYGGFLFNTEKEATEKALKDLNYKNILDLEQPIHNEIEKHLHAIPDAPFKKTWHELALKRMLREAAEKGYDRLSWTPGEAQAARYDLSKHIDKLTYSNNGQLWAWDKNGKQVVNKSDVNKDNLADFIGKEAAKKLMDQKEQVSKGAPGPNYRTLEGADLKVGGEGMKGFYDQIIPKALEKIGKEHGVKVKQSGIDIPGGIGQWKYTGPEKSIEELIKLYESQKLSASLKSQLSDVLAKMGAGTPYEKALENHGSYALAEALGGKLKPVVKQQPIHYIDIPQSLKDQAMHKGFPLFSGGFMLNPVDHDPFSKEKK